MCACVYASLLCAQLNVVVREKHSPYLLAKPQARTDTRSAKPM